MKHREGRFAGCGGRSIYWQCWQPDTAPRVVLLLVHGAGEHSGRYQSLARYFTDRGFAVAALDHNGHGHSEGRQGYVDSFDNYLADLDAFHRQVARQFTGVPIVLLGHSMGGLIGSNYLLQHQEKFAGAIFSGPLIKPEPQPGSVQIALIRLLAAVLPRLGILQLDAGNVSRDPDVVRQYVEDPLVHHGKMSARLLRELFAGMNAIQAGAARITLPVLILHGAEDVLAAPEGARFLHGHIGSSDKTLNIYPGLYHEIFNEPEQAEVLADVLHWCEARVTGR